MKTRLDEHDDPSNGGRQVDEGRLHQSSLWSPGTIMQICAWCDRVLDRSGHWREAEENDRTFGSAPPSHGICPDCVERLDLGA